MNHELASSQTALTVESVQSSALPGRLVSIDVYRGLAMLLMMAEVLHLRMVSNLWNLGLFARFTMREKEWMIAE